MNKSTIIGFLVGVILIALVLAIYVGVKKMGSIGTVAIEASEGRMEETVKKVARKTPAEHQPIAMILPDFIVVDHALPGNGSYTPGDVVEVKVTLNKKKDDLVRALGLAETLPQGWTFDSVIAGDHPDLVPPQGRENLLEFAWFNIPEFPTTFTYRVRSAAKDAGRAVITGQAVFRTDGPEYRSPKAHSTLQTNGQPAIKKTTQDLLRKNRPADQTPQKELSGKEMELVHTVAENAYTPGETITLTAQMDYGKADAVKALALIETLPAGWVFDGIVSGPNPAVVPPKGASGELNFVWIQIPEFPATLSYRITVPKGEEGKKQLRGAVIYRSGGPEVSIEPIFTDLEAKSAPSQEAAAPATP